MQKNDQKITAQNATDPLQYDAPGLVWETEPLSARSRKNPVNTALAL